VDYKQLMQQAIELANQSANFGDVPVGALIVNEHGEVVATGQNLREKDNDPTAHAEMVAIKNAGNKIGNWRLDDLTLVVTLEPCVMCAGAIAQSRMKRLVFGAFDEKAGAVGSVFDVLRGPRTFNNIEIVNRIMSKECSEILKDFFVKKRVCE
jgi:tRNA(adenine34) deaminase